MYRKFLVALAGFAAVVASVASDGVIASAEAETLIEAGVTAGLVWLVRNKQPAA